MRGVGRSGASFIRDLVAGTASWDLVPFKEVVMGLRREASPWGNVPLPGNHSERSRSPVASSSSTSWIRRRSLHSSQHSKSARVIIARRSAADHFASNSASVTP